jgi:ABC-type multidrug transport system ATPase subunit
MGQSGGGKSTFLNVLTGKAGYGETKGKIYINGSNAKITDFRNQVGFGNF